MNTRPKVELLQTHQTLKFSTSRPSSLLRFHRSTPRPWPLVNTLLECDVWLGAVPVSFSNMPMTAAMSGQGKRHNDPGAINFASGCQEIDLVLVRLGGNPQRLMTSKSKIRLLWNPLWTGIRGSCPAEIGTGKGLNSVSFGLEHELPQNVFGGVA